MADPANTGIYEIVNRASGKRYIGSAVSIEQRWREHRMHLRRGSHHNRHLQASWIKHGEEFFDFRIIIICASSELIPCEQRAINSSNPEFNISRIAGSTLGIKFTNETRSKIAAKAIGRKRSRESIEAGAAKLRGVPLSPERVKRLYGNKYAVGLRHTEEWKKANSERHRGAARPKTPEHRAKSSLALKGVPHSLERRAKQAAAQIGLKRKPYNIKPKTPEQIAIIGAAISARLRGRKRSPETIEKMRAASTGKKKTEETRDKLSSSLKRMWAERRDEILLARAHSRINAPPVIRDYSKMGPKISAALKGRKVSLEARLNMSASRLGKKRGPYKPRRLTAIPDLFGPPTV